MDTREQKPFRFIASKNCAGMRVQKLDHGDYQIDGHPDLISIERKQSVSELCGNIGRNRERFERELQRMQESKLRYVIVEDHYSSIKSGRFVKLSPNVIWGSIIGLELKYGVRFIFAGNRANAHRITRELLTKAYDYKMKGKLYA